MTNRTIGIVAINEFEKEVAYFTSRNATAHAGYDKNHVRKVLRGERETHQGLSFKKLSAKQTKTLVSKFGTCAVLTPKQAKRLI